MIKQGQRYLVMGVLDPDSIAYAIGRTLVQHGATVIYSMQNEVLKRRFFDRSTKISDEEKASLEIHYCDVTNEESVQALFAEVGDLTGVVHSIAYANPKTCLGAEFHTEAMDDVTKSYHISCASLATVARHAVPHMPDGGSIISLSFDTRHVYPHYNWMGVHKAAMEALVRALARRHGRDLVRVNAVSAGPLSTMAASKIPGFSQLSEVWDATCPLPWDPTADKQAVADAAMFLLSDYAQKITGQVLTVDGGVSIIGGPLCDFERPAADSAS